MLAHSTHFISHCLSLWYMLYLLKTCTVFFFLSFRPFHATFPTFYSFTHSFFRSFSSLPSPPPRAFAFSFIFSSIPFQLLLFALCVFAHIDLGARATRRKYTLNSYKHTHTHTRILILVSSFFLDSLFCLDLKLNLTLLCVRYSYVRERNIQPCLFAVMPFSLT